MRVTRFASYTAFRALLRSFTFQHCSRRAFLSALAVALYAALLCLEPALAAETRGEAWWLDSRWPHERGTLTPDPGATFGRLKNGVRYQIIPNAKPEGRVSLYLSVQAGSLMETEAQRGFAHFVEHMAFNGSRSFAPGTLIPFFQKNGMSFGSDTNAHTSFTETVYKLNLPAVDVDSLQQGLRVLRDFGDGLLFLPAEVERERGVILAEKNSRDSEIARAGRHMQAFLFPEGRFTHEPIGKESTVQSATPEGLRAFYQTWYRPERMTLVVVGSVDANQIASLVEAIFGDMRAKGDSPVVEPWGAPEHQGIKAFYEQRPIGATMVGIASMRPRKHETDSEAVQREMLLQVICGQMLQMRLQQCQQGADAPWTHVRTKMGATFGLFPTAGLTAVTQGARWEKALHALERELRYALTDGFTQVELDEAIRDTLTSMECRLKERGNLQNGSLAAEAVECLGADRVFMSAEQNFALYKKLAAALSVEDANAFFREAWSAENRLLTVSGDAVLEHGEKTLTAAYEAGAATALPERAFQADAPFPYLPQPTYAAALPELAERTLNNGSLHVFSGTFANGLTVQLVPSSLGKGRVTTRLIFGGGLASLPEEKVGAAKLAEAVLAKNGPGKLTRLESMRLFAKYPLAVKERYSSRYFSISGGAPAEQTELLLQAMHTAFSDPFPREEALNQVRQDLTPLRHVRKNTVPGAVQAEAGPFLNGPAARNKPLDDESAASLSLADVRSAIAATRENGPRHLIIIGDFDPKTVLARVAALFGSSSFTASGGAQQGAPLCFPTGECRVLSVSDTVDKAMLLSAWQRDLPRDAGARTLMVRRMLAEILNERLREALREDLGACYAPTAYYRAHEMENGYGMYQVNVETDGKQMEAASKALDRVTNALAQDGVTTAELEKLLPATLAGWKTSRESNELWLDLLVQEYLTKRPCVVWNDSLPELLQSITKKELDAEAAAAFTPQGRAQLTVVKGEEQAK